MERQRKQQQEQGEVGRPLWGRAFSTRAERRLSPMEISLREKAKTHSTKLKKKQRNKRRLHLASDRIISKLTSTIYAVLPSSKRRSSSSTSFGGGDASNNTIDRELDKFMSMFDELEDTDEGEAWGVLK
jgi:hypothetical protein